MVNQKDVAKKAGVSQATVSRVINNAGYISPELKDKINKAIDGLDYSPNLIARSLKMSSTKTIGMIFPDIENSFFISLITKAEETAFLKGYSIILCNSQNDPEKEKIYINILKGKLVDGFIIITSFDDKSFLETALKNEKVVYMDRSIGIKDEVLVKLNNIKGSQLAIEYLIGMGHKKIGFIGVPTDITTGFERYEGYKKTLKNHGIGLNKDYVRFCDFSADNSYNKTKEVLTQKNGPTAILTISPPVTIGALKVINELNLKIPDDISIIGFDDLKTSELLSPPLTVVIQPAYRFGEVGINTLIKKIEGNKLNSKTIILEPELIVRKSCYKIL